MLDLLERIDIAMDRGTKQYGLLREAHEEILAYRKFATEMTRADVPLSVQELMKINRIDPVTGRYRRKDHG